MLNLAANLNALYEIAIDADAIARAIAYVIEQPGDVDVNKMKSSVNNQDRNP